MSDETIPKTTNIDDIEFNPKIEAKEEDIALDLIDLEINNEEIIKVYDIHNEWNKFFTEKEYQTLLEESLDIKKSNINAVYSNPLYFIKKIIYFYNKETFFDSYFLTLKSPHMKKIKGLVQEKKSISFKAKFHKSELKASLNFDLKTKMFNGTIKPDNKEISFTFNTDKNNNILIPIKDYDENKNEIMIIPKIIKNDSKQTNNNQTFSINNSNIESNNNNKINEIKNEINPIHNPSDNIIQKEENNQNINSLNDSSVNNKDNVSNEFSRNETLMSYDEKDDENLEIVVKENNDNLLKVFHREKLEGDTYESIANKTFELMCNISLDRNIDVKNFINKKPKKINLFFNLKGDKKIKDFQIDSYISKITGKELNKIKEKFPNNFFFFENLKLKGTEN